MRGVVYQRGLSTKVFLLAILRAEKRCVRIPKRDAEELLEEQRRILKALSWGKTCVASSRDSARETSKQIYRTLSRVRERREGWRKTESSSERIGGPEQSASRVAGMAQISQTLQQHHLQKEKIYEETQDAEERKQRVKNLPYERLAKYNPWPQTKVIMKHLNFNSQTSKTLMR